MTQRIVVVDEECEACLGTGRRLDVYGKPTDVKCRKCGGDGREESE